MSRLPTPGGDSGQWGQLLNDFLAVEHNADGSLKRGADIDAKADDISVVHLAGAETVSGAKSFALPVVVPTPTDTTHAATKGYVDSLAMSGGVTPDADAITKGKVRLAGDLSGTASTPVVAAGVIDNAKIAAGAAIAQNKIANLTTDLASKYTIPVNGIPENDLAAAVQEKLNAPPAIDDGSVTLAKLDSATQSTLSSVSGKQSTSAKGSANGYAGLNASAVVPTSQLGSGVASNSTFLRGDGTWATASSSTNTASNIGTDGVGIYKQKTGDNLEFKKINAGSTKVTITDDTAANEVDIDIAESALTLGNLGGTLGVSKGGTGATSLTGLVKGNGTSAMTSAVAGTDYPAMFNSWISASSPIMSPESSRSNVLNYYMNDIAYNRQRGGATRLYYNGVLQTGMDATTDLLFTPNAQAVSINFATGNITEIKLEIDLCRLFRYGTKIGYAVNEIWRAQNVLIEYYRISTSSWVTVANVSNVEYGEQLWTVGGDATGFQQVRLTFSNFANMSSSLWRCGQIFVIGYDSNLGEGPFVSRGGGEIYGVVNLNANKITSVADPTNAQDVATKSYVDTRISTKTSSVPFSQGGTATTGVSAAWRAPVAGTITRVTLMAGTAPTGSGLTVQFLRNGSAISTQTIAAGTTSDATTTLSTAIAAGDKLSVNATSVGSTTAATNVTAQFDITHTA